MYENKKDKILRLLALANDANDHESMVALAKAQKLMLEYGISESEVFNYRQQDVVENVIDTVIYEGKPQKWVYRLARIISKNFRVKYYYESTTPIKLHFVGTEMDAQIAEITFQYAKGSVSYSAKSFMQLPEVKRKYKRKWELKQDYIEGYLRGLSEVLTQQVLTNGYELALVVPAVVTKTVEELGLVPGKDMSHTIQDHYASRTGYKDGLKFKHRNLIEE